MAQYKRKKIYLGWNLHGRIVARVLAYWVCYHLVLWGGIFAYQYLSYRSATHSGDSNAAYDQFIASFLKASLWFLIYALTVGAAITWNITRITHRIVGPLKRVEATLERLSAGESVQAIKFRKGDLISSLEQAFNQYLTSLNVPYQTTLSQAQRESDAARERAEALQKASAEAALGVEETAEAAPAATCNRTRPPVDSFGPRLVFCDLAPEAKS
jgi:methyl-accepting chemotaxis protein